MTRLLVSFAVGVAAAALVVFSAWMSGWNFERGSLGGPVALFAPIAGVLVGVVVYLNSEREEESGGPQ